MEMDLNCLICGDALKSRRHNVFDTVSDHSRTFLYELVQKALGFELDLALFESDEDKAIVCLCESCYGKINNYDLGLTLSEKAQRELEKLLEEKIKKQETMELKLDDPEEDFSLIKDEDAMDVYPEIGELTGIASVGGEEMEEEHLIEYEEEQSFDEEDTFDQVLIQDSDQSEGEIVKKLTPKQRGRKFTRNIEQGRFYCDICNAGYTTQEALDLHTERHRNVGVNECPECHKKFAQKSALTRHMPMHTGEKPYQCTQCGKRFIHYSSFNMHMLIHDDVRLKKCKICGLALRSTSHLSRHMRVHTGEKPYACPTCGQKFAQRYNMNAHMKSHQGIKRMPAKPTECPLCDAVFRVKGKLKDHIREVHGETVAIVEPSSIETENGEGWVIIKDDLPKKLTDGVQVEGVALLQNYQLENLE
ncbi:zinc finger protein 771-like [Culicoides brevitarsis]|uniref:zinc finger protein 771-like n=1 Tax=Culicoides brevitarsis TaxID=469753 RepID=UPI00307CAF86